MENSEKNRIPCFLCGKLLKVKQSKNNKPYFICEPCGVQAFIRCKPGIRRFKNLLQLYGEKPGAFLEHDSRVYRYLQLLGRISELERQLGSLEQSQSIGEYIFGDSDKEQAAKTLKREVTRTKQQLRDLAAELPK